MRKHSKREQREEARERVGSNKTSFTLKGLKEVKFIKNKKK